MMERRDVRGMRGIARGVGVVHRDVDPGGDVLGPIHRRLVGPGLHRGGRGGVGVVVAHVYGDGRDVLGPVRGPRGGGARRGAPAPHACPACTDALGHVFLPVERGGTVVGRSGLAFLLSRGRFRGILPAAGGGVGEGRVMLTMVVLVLVVVLLLGEFERRGRQRRGGRFAG